MMLYFSGGELLILWLSDRVRGRTDYIIPVGEGYTWVSVICEHHLFLIYSCPRVRLLGVLTETQSVYQGQFLVIPGLTFSLRLFRLQKTLLSPQLLSSVLLLIGKRANVSKKKHCRIWGSSLCIFFLSGIWPLKSQLPSI